MDHLKKAHIFYGAVSLLFVLLGCNYLSKIGSTPTVSPSPPPSPPLSCMGWDCTLRGVVYAGEAAPGNELGGVKVSLSHHSNCSPTRGEHEAITDTDGVFEFDVYVHDTDSFRFEIEHDGYKPAGVFFGGFDCLFCSCKNLEFVLEPLGDSAK